MESIRGKHATCVDPATLVRQISKYPQILFDLGTGDGRFVRHVATTCPDTSVLGIDLCAANMREASRRAPANALYLVGSAFTLPGELYGLATHIVINFPWGELLTGLLSTEMRLPRAIAALGRQGARLEIRLNTGALTAAGWTLRDACTAIHANLHNSGFSMSEPRLLDARELRAFPTTWAHRLAFGRDPRALYLHGVKTA